MWMRRVIAVRRQHAVFGRGGYRLLYPKNRKILAYLREDADTTILCVANLSRTPQAVELDLSEFQGRVPIELDGHSLFPPIGQLTYLLTLPPYGFYWFLLSEAEDWPSSHTPAPEPMPEYQTIVMRHALPDAIAAARPVIERDVLPQYLAKRRWFAMKDQTLRSIRIALLTRVPSDDAVLLEIETETDTGTARWLLPLGIVWGDESAPPLPTQLALARVRRGAKVGLLTDAFALPTLALAVLAGLAQKDIIVIDQGVIRFEPTSRIADITVPSDVEMNWIAAEQSNSSVIVGDLAIVKMFRRVTNGPHPEAEMSRHLTEQGFSSTPALLGEVVRVDSDGTRHALVIAQTFVRNQGDAWTWTQDLLLRGLSDITSGDEAATEHSEYVHFAALLGQRLGEMHRVLARPSSDPAFAPAAGTAETAATFAERAHAQLEAACCALDAVQQWNDAAAQDYAFMQGARTALLAAIPDLADRVNGATLTRIHGDLHLGQILVCSGDIAIIDFEGEPAKPVAMRRAKDHPLRDVAGMIRSFDYAAAVVKRRSQSSHAHLSDEQVAAFLDSFVECATDAFQTGYREALASATEQAFIATNSELLDLFLIEKAAYEVVYEAANRPTWIDVPLHGLARRARQLLGIEALA
jgi:maltose alpha-D-glucosyltransferase/alpha-amylase